MNCERFQEWIEEATLGTLDDSRHAQLDTHLDACAECRHAFEAGRALFAAIDRGLAAGVEGKPSPDFAARVRMRLADEGERAGFRSWWRPAAWIPIMAGAALALLLLTVWFARRPSHTPGPQTAQSVSKPAAPRPATSSEQAKATQAPPETARPSRMASRSIPAATRRASPGGQEPQPQVLVEHGQWAAVTKLYNSDWAPDVKSDAPAAESGSSPATAAPGLANAGLKPVEIAPVEIVPLDPPGTGPIEGVETPGR